MLQYLTEKEVVEQVFGQTALSKENFHSKTIYIAFLW